MKTLQLYKLIAQWMRATYMYMSSVKVEVFCVNGINKLLRPDQGSKTYSKMNESTNQQNVLQF